MNLLTFNTIINHEKVKQDILPHFSEEFDIIVVGGGTAGVCAALTAAETNKVLCIERGTFLGGMGSGIVFGYYYGSDLEDQTLDEIIKLDSAENYCKCKGWCAGIHPDAKKQCYQNEYLDLGGKLMYKSIVTGVWMSETAAVGVRVLSGGTETDIAAKFIIDATAEANVCRLAGFETKIGRESDGQCQAYSLVGIVMNGSGELEHVYRDNGFVDTSDCFEVSRAVTDGFENLDETGAYTSTEGNRLLSLGSIFGKREGVTIVGEDSLTGEQMLNFLPVDKPLFYTSSTYDTHLYDPEFETETVQEYRYFVDDILTQPVPLGALVPKGGKNIMAAGLGMDIDHDALASVRLKRNVMRAGTAAAIAAETAITEGCDVFSCYEKITEKLKAKRIYKEVPELSETAKNINEKAAEYFSSDSPKLRGCAVYYASRMMTKEELMKFLDNKNTAVCAAKALAMQGFGIGAEYFKDEEIPGAVYLLGKINKHGEYTDLLAGKLHGKLLPTAFSALVRNAANGDKKAEKLVRGLVENKDFSYKITLNGKKNHTVLERCETFRKYIRHFLGA